MGYESHRIRFYLYAQFKIGCISVYFIVWKRNASFSLLRYFYCQNIMWFKKKLGLNYCIVQNLNSQRQNVSLNMEMVNNAQKLADFSLS